MKQWNHPDNDPIDIPGDFWPPKHLRTDIIRLIAHKIGARRYLEIGVSDGWVFNQFDFEYKVGVEPRSVSPSGVHRCTSDEYFARHNDDAFDIIFIDGLHEYVQVCRDIKNGIERLRPDGFMIIHDMMPKNYYESTYPKIKGGHTPAWTGDVWRAAFDLAQSPDIKFRLCTTDFGCGILQKRTEQHKRKYPPVSDWNHYKANWTQLPLIRFQEIETVYFSNT